MKAQKGNKTFEIWEISKTTPRPTWVEEEFRAGKFIWLDEQNDNHLRIFMPQGITSWNTGSFVAESGEFVEREKHNIISVKKFEKDYEIIEE